MRVNQISEISDQIRNEYQRSTSTVKTTADHEADAVTLSVSKEGMEKYLDSTQEAPQDNSWKQELQDFAEQMRENEEEESPTEEMGKMLEVARRIANGDRVPSKDEQALMEYNRDLYQAAKAAAMLHANEEHKTYGSMWEEEDNQEMDEKIRALERENGATMDINFSVDKQILRM